MYQFVIGSLNHPVIDFKPFKSAIMKPLRGKQYLDIILLLSLLKVSNHFVFLKRFCGRLRQSNLKVCSFVAFDHITHSSSVIKVCETNVLFIMKPKRHRVKSKRRVTYY